MNRSDCRHASVSRGPTADLLADLAASTALCPVRRQRSRLQGGAPASLAIAVAVAAVLTLGASPEARAQTVGGDGGSVLGTAGGAGGAFNQPGGNAAIDSGTGGGGGGATASNAAGAQPGGLGDGNGGNGGAGGLNGYDSSLGGFDATTAYTGTVGQSGGNIPDSFSNGSGGGGAGGYGAILAGTGPFATQALITAGNGGNGGGVDAGYGFSANLAGSSLFATEALINGVNAGYGYGATPSGGYGAGGGRGGGGGIGVVVNDSAILTVAGTAQIAGGNGGSGAVIGAYGSTTAGAGGDGGTGIVFLTGGQLLNAGSIVGGAGAASADGFAPGGVGGAGVTGTNLAVTTGGTITGGLAGDGVTRANAVTFTGGTNSLTLQAGYAFTGAVAAFSTADTFALGGAANATFDVSQIGAAGSGQQFSGFGVFQKTGSSTWTLTGTPATTPLTSWQVLAGTLAINTDAVLGAAGATLTLNGGALETTASFATTRSITLGAGGGAFNTDAATTFTIGSVIGGPGGLTKIGAGTLALAASNSYGGGTAMDAGTLIASADANLGAAAGPLSFAGGTLQLGASFDLATTRAVTLNAGGGTIATNGFTIDIGSAVTGAGGLTQSGAGTLNLLNANSYQGGTTVNGGTVGFGSGAAFGSGTIVLTNGTIAPLATGFVVGNAVTLGTGTDTVATGAFDLTLSGTIGGASPLIKTGAGTLGLTHANDYTGGTQLQAGTVAVSSNTALGTGPLAMSSGTTLAFIADGLALANAVGLAGPAGGTVDTSANTATLAGVVSGAALTKVGGGTLILTATNTYGGTAINGGTLVAAADANLGAATGPLAFATGTLRLGASFDLATTRSVTLNAGGGTIDTNGFAMTIGSSIGGAGSLSKAGAGLLILAGTNTYGGGTAIDGGSLGVSADANLGAATGPLAFAGGTLRLGASFDLSTSRAVTLNAGGGTINTNGFSTAIGSAIGGTGGLTKIGAGTLTLTATNTYGGGTALDGGILVASADANLGAATGPLAFGGGTLRLGASFDIATSRAITLNGGGGTIDTNGFATTIGSSIGGTGGLAKIGAGTLNLLSADTYAGGTSISAGTVGFASGGAFGTNGVALANATIAPLATGLSVGNGITLGAGTDTVATGLFDLALTGTIGGGGALTKTGAGALTLTGTNTYAGGTAIDGGAIVASSDANLGAATGPLALAAGTLRLGASFDLATSRAVTLNAGGGTVDTNGFSTSIGSAVGGPGGLTKTGAGTLNLLNTNTYAGGTAVTGGVLGFASGGAFGGGGITLANGTLAPLATGLSVGNDIALGAGTDIVATGGFDLALGGVIGGSGALTKTGSGTLSLTRANGYAGGTALQGGTIAVGDAQALGGGTLGMGDGTTLRLAADGLTIANPVAFGGTVGGTIDTGANTGTLAGVVAGAGGLTKTGPGTLVLTNTNTYGGGTAIDGGTLVASADGNLGAATGPLSFASGTLRLAASFDLSTARTVTLNAGGGTLDTNGFATTIGSAIGGSGGLTVIGGGTLDLATANTYGGGTAIAASTVGFASGGAFGAGPIALSGGTLAPLVSGLSVGNGITLNAGGGTVATGVFDLTLAGPIDGSGALTKTGGGALALTHANSYTGGTLLRAGTLIVGDDLALGTATLSMDEGTTLGFSASGLTLANDIVFTGAVDPTIDTGAASETLSGIISGPGALTKLGTGTLDLTGISTYTGATTIGAGTLLVDGSIANSVVTVGGGGTVGGSGTLGGLIVLAGATVAPGTAAPFSTLGVAGNVAFANGSAYVVRVNGAGQTDRINATGTAALDSGSTVSVLAATGTPYSAGETFTILTAAGGRSGTFASPPTTTSNLAFLSPSLTYTANDVVLTLARSSVAFPSVAGTLNQAGSAAAIQGLGNGNPLYDAVLGQTAAGARQAFDATSGEAHASTATTAVVSSRFVSTAILDRLWNIGGAGLDAFQVLQGFGPTNLPVLLRCYAPDPGSVPAMASSYTVWGQAIGDFGRNGGNGNAATLDRTMGGFIFGIDAPVYGKMGDVWRFGASAGYTKDFFNTAARDSEGTYGSTFGSLYGGARFGSVDLRFGASYEWNSTTLRRTVAFPGFEKEHSTSGGDTALGFGELGYRLAVAQTVFEPIAGFTALHVHQDAFNETGGVAALKGFGHDTDVQTTNLGFRAESTPFASVPMVARMMLGWQHAFGDLVPTALVAFESGSLPFSVAGAPIDRDSAVAELQLDYRWTSNVTVGLSYKGQVGQRDDDNAVRGEFDVRF